MDLPDIPPDLMRIFVINVLVGILCGGTIGLERQILGKPAGLRVCILVVLTTAYFVTIATHIAPENGDQARVLASIITGVGFLGAGVIFSRGGKVSGITTASLIWALAAIGCSIGFGYPGVAVIATLVIMIILAVIDMAEYLFPRLRREAEPDTRQSLD